MLEIKNYPTKADMVKEEIEKHLKGKEITVITDKEQNLKIDFTTHSEPVNLEVEVLGPDSFKLEFHDELNTYFGRLRIVITDYESIKLQSYNKHLFLIECYDNNGVDLKAQYQIYIQSE